MDTLLDHPSTLGGFDIVHVEHLRGARYGLRIRQRHSEIPVVWDSVDCISLLFQQAAGHSKRKVSRLISSFELQRNHAYEGWLPGQFNHTLVTSQLDLQAFRDLIKQNGHTPRISVLPNGVDLDYFQPDETRQRQADTLVISGKMSYHANVTMVLYFVEQVLPRIQATRPEAKLWVVGKDPAREIQALGNRPGVVVTGTVEDLRPYLQQAAVAVSPVIYGAGIQNKVLEAMACGTPVVSTPQAVSALNTRPGEDVLIGQDPDDFAKLVIDLLADPHYQREVGQAGLRYVEKFHHWSAIAARLEGIYDEAVRNKK
jgi:glycosyltransferase involved in cell wall biosynthesis